MRDTGIRYRRSRCISSTATVDAAVVVVGVDGHPDSRSVIILLPPLLTNVEDEEEDAVARQGLDDRDE